MVGECVLKVGEFRLAANRPGSGCKGANVAFVGCKGLSGISTINIGRDNGGIAEKALPVMDSIRGTAVGTEGTVVEVTGDGSW